MTSLIDLSSLPLFVRCSSPESDGLWALELKVNILGGQTPTSDCYKSKLKSDAIHTDTAQQ